MGNLLWSSDRPEFCERVAKLAGAVTALADEATAVVQNWRKEA